MKKIKLLLKLSVSVLLLYFVLQKIDINQIFNLYKNSNPLIICLAIVLFTISQIVSSYRLLTILHKANFKIKALTNLKLYVVGMFYNFFIPGGIGGDAYKVFILNKTYKWKVKTLTQSIIVDRLIGLNAIIALILLLTSTLTIKTTWLTYTLILLSILSFLTGKKIINYILNFLSKKVYNKTFCISLVIQLLQSACICCLVYAITSQFNLIPYILIFLVSSVLSVVSFSGFGIREYVYLQASNYLLINTQTGIAVGLAFNLITAIISLLGVYYTIFGIKYQNKKII